MNERVRRVLIAVLVAVAVNSAGLIAMLGLTTVVSAVRGETDSRATAVRFDPPRRRPPPPRRATRRVSDLVGSAAPSVSPPRVASAIRAPGMAADLSTGELGELWQNEVGVDADLFFKESVVEVKPRLLAQVKPSYPRFALQRKITGFVTLRIHIDATGTVTKTAVAEAEPPGVFERSALAAAEQYRFAPGRVGGRSVPTVVTRKLTFGPK